ncbi:MAG TPA: TonB-dependent receptor, partial [Bacteroidia bacterium]
MHISFFAQKFTISGTVKDKTNGETAIGANVYLKETTIGAATNVYGFYSINAEKGTYILVCSYLGYEVFEKEITLDKNQTINISLQPAAVTTEEVVINAKADDNVKSTQMSSVQMDIQQIKKLPAFMGEVDVLKTIQLIPGVKSAGDGQTGFYVRGGGPDQNLILLDEAVVYNASHLMGFFSVFNGDAIKNVNLIKGGMPAQYGQRLSSVLDITMKEGNNQRFQVDGGIGLISSRLTVQGPIKKDTASFIISARRTYIDAIVKPIFKHRNSPFQGTSYYFYDLNAKFNYQVNKKNKIMLSGYFGRDVFNFKDADAGFNINVPWGNATASLRWNHIYNEKLFSNTTAVFSHYDFTLGALQDNFEFKLFSGVRDYNLKHDFSWFPNARHLVRFGANYTFHTFIPTTASAQQGDVKFDLGGIIKLYCHEAQTYVGDDIKITENLQVHAGLRFGYFAQVGPFTRYKKNEFSKITDTIYYNQGKKVKDYNGLEPRFSMRYRLNKSSSVKASYTYNKQYVHLASLSSVSLPTDVWMPST